MKRALQGLFASVVLSLGSVASAQHYTTRFFTIYGEPREMVQLEFSPKSDRLVVVPEGGPISVIDTATGDIEREIKFAPFAVKFSGDGAKLLAIETDETRLIDIRTGTGAKLTWNIPPAYVGCKFKEKNGKLVIDAIAENSPAANSASLQPGDELTAVIESDQSTSLLGKPAILADKLLAGPPGTPVVLRVIPKGKTKPVDVSLIRKAASTDRGQLRFKDLKAGSSPNACMISAAGSFVLLGADGGEVLSVLRSLELEPTGMYALSPDGNLFAWSSRRLKTPQGESSLAIEIYDVRTQERTHFAPLEARSINEARFTPDGGQLLIASNDRIVVYDIAAKEFKDPILVGFDPLVKRPELPRNEALEAARERLGTAGQEATETIVTSFDISPNGKTVAVGTPHGECGLWAIDRYERVGGFGEKSDEWQRVENVTFSRDGKWVAYYVEGTVHLVSVNEGLAAAVEANTETAEK